jgi:crotonobetaine/carnitine-CoA ligase
MEGMATGAMAEFPLRTIAALVEDVRRPMAADAGIEIDRHFLDYAALRQRARSIAANLQALGLRKGDRVASLMTSRIEVVLTWFGTALAGGVWVPLNVSLVKDDLATTLRNAQASIIVADAASAERLREPAVSAALPDRRYVVGAPAQGFRPFDELLDGAAAYAPVALRAGDPAVIIYTGGSTGLPKGVLLPHFACVAAAYRYAEAFRATSRDRHFATSPLFHAGGLFVAVLGPMLAGMRTTIDRQFSVSAYWARVRESGATLINPPGVALTMLCRQPPCDDDRKHAVRAGLGLTGQLPPDIPAAFSRRFGIPLINLYSLSEASGALMVFNPLDSPKPDSNGTGGRWSEIAIADEHGELLPPGTLGRILLRPKIPHTFMIAYHNDPAATVRAFRNLWLNTGDLGVLDRDGYLHFKGREAHWLRRRGENISAYEVEEIMSRHPEIAEVVIVGTPSELGEEEVRAFILPEPGARIDPADVVAWCLARMALFKVPRYVEFVDAFPRAAAKPEVDRVQLKNRPNDTAWDREKALGRQFGRVTATP